MATVRSGASVPPADAGAPDGGAAAASADRRGRRRGRRITTVSLTERSRCASRLDPVTDTVRANFGLVFTALDLSESLTCEAAPMCAPSYAALGVPGPQRVFSKD